MSVLDLPRDRGFGSSCPKAARTCSASCSRAGAVDELFLTVAPQVAGRCEQRTASASSRARRSVADARRGPASDRACAPRTTSSFAIASSGRNEEGAHEHDRTVVIVGAGLAGREPRHALRERGLRGRASRSSATSRSRPTTPAAVEGLPARRAPIAKAATSSPRTSTTSSASSCGPGRRVDAIDARRATVTLDDGERLSFDRLLLATGVAAAASDVPGADLPGVVTLATLRRRGRDRGEAAAEAERMRRHRRRLDRQRGRGVAAAARRPRDAPDHVGRRRRSSGCSGREVGGVYRDLHLENGVAFRPGTSVARFIGDRSRPGRRDLERRRADRRRPGRRGHRRRTADRAGRAPRVSRSATASRSSATLETSRSRDLRGRRCRRRVASVLRAGGCASSTGTTPSSRAPRPAR